MLAILLLKAKALLSKRPRKDVPVKTSQDAS